MELRAQCGRGDGAAGEKRLHVGGEAGRFSDAERMRLPRAWDDAERAAQNEHTITRGQRARLTRGQARQQEPRARGRGQLEAA